jgi:exosortase
MEQFKQEFSRIWPQISNKPIFFALLISWSLLFQFLGNSTFGYVDTSSLFEWMHNAYNVPESEDGHGNLIPFVVLALFWWKRNDLLAIPQKPWWPALGLTAAALMLHVAGYLLQQPRISIAALFIGLYSLIGVVWGSGWLKASFFPFVLFVFCMPIGTMGVIEQVTLPMRQVSTACTFAITKGILGLDVVRHGTQLLDASGEYNYDVAAACSGIRSLISLLALTTVFAMITFRTTWKRMLIVLLSFPLTLLCNTLRLTGVVIAAEAFGPKAGNFVHDWSGFFTYAIAIGCILAVGHWLREAEPPKPVLATPETATA